MRSGDAASLSSDIETVQTVVLDVTNEEHLRRLPRSLPQRLDAVVNNAGIALTAPLETVELDDLRRLLEVNLVGQLAVTKAVLPHLRVSRGRVAFVSSLSGRIATPLTGAYNASKFALEGLADALRLELAPWRVNVVLVEPPQVDTDILRDAERHVAATMAGLSVAQRALYTGHFEGYRLTIATSRKVAIPADLVAATVEEALTARRPRARYVPASAQRLREAMALRLPTVLRDRVLRREGGVPERA